MREKTYAWVPEAVLLVMVVVIVGAIFLHECAEPAGAALANVTRSITLDIDDWDRPVVNHKSHTGLDLSITIQDSGEAYSLSGTVVQTGLKWSPSDTNFYALVTNSLTAGGTGGVSVASFTDEQMATNGVLYGDCFVSEGDAAVVPLGQFRLRLVRSIITGEEPTYAAPANAGWADDGTTIADIASATLVNFRTNVTASASGTTIHVDVTPTAAFVTDGDKGDVTVATNGTVWTVTDWAITSVQTNAGAADISDLVGLHSIGGGVRYKKAIGDVAGDMADTVAAGISEGAYADSTITSDDIKDGEIANADVSATAAIATSKIGWADRHVYYVGPDGVGDDSADGRSEGTCWATLGHALDSVASSNVVVLLSGRHTLGACDVNGVISAADDGLVIAGMGMLATELVLDNEGDGEEIKGMITVNADDVTIRDMTMTFRYDGGTDNAIGGGCVGFRLENVRLTSDFDLIYLSSMDDVVIEGCEFIVNSAGTSIGISTGVADPALNTTIRNCTFSMTSGNDGDALSVSGASTVYVDGCRVASNQGGLWVAAAGTVRLSGCVMETTGDTIDTSGTLYVIGGRYSSSGGDAIDYDGGTATVSGAAYSSAAGTITPGMPGGQLVAQSVANAALADDAVGADELAADAVVKASLAAVDFGDFAADADGTCSLDADVVAAAEMADADHGDISWSGGVASVDSGAVAVSELAAPVRYILYSDAAGHTITGTTYVTLSSFTLPGGTLGTSNVVEMSGFMYESNDGTASLRFSYGSDVQAAVGTTTAAANRYTMGLIGDGTTTNQVAYVLTSGTGIATGRDVCTVDSTSDQTINIQGKCANAAESFELEWVLVEVIRR